MIRHILVSLLLVLCAGVAWAAPYADPKGLFTLVPPASWTQDKASFKNADNTQALILKSVAPALSLEEWGASKVTKSKEQWQDVQIKDVKLDGQKAKRITCYKPSGDKTVRIEQYLVLKDKDGVVLTFVSTKGDSTDLAAVAAPVLKSFKFR